MTLLGHALLRLDDNITIGTGTEPQVGVTAHIVNEGEVDVALPEGGVGDVGQHQVLVQDGVALRHHAGQAGGHPGADLGLAVYTPTLHTEAVTTTWDNGNGNVS